MMTNGGKRVCQGLIAACSFVLLIHSTSAQVPAPGQTNQPATAPAVTAQERALAAFQLAKTKFNAEPNNAELGWTFARAAFDWAEFAADNKQREEIALQGIAAARRSVVLAPRSAAAHYYLSMNLGQLARTKTIGALKLVDEMEREFKKARELDQDFDFAGPDRNLGLLYLEAPSFSVGDRRKARVHLIKAVELSDVYPENRLNLIEAYIRWGETKLAIADLEKIEKLWPQAKEQFKGDHWRFSWPDWEKRLMAIRKTLKTVAK